MATVTTTRLIDDLDGKSAAAETVNFALDGVTFEIDLTEANATELRQLLARYVARARRTGGRVQRGRPAVSRPDGKPVLSSQAAQRAEAKAVRDWARRNGFELSDRGRIPVKVLEAYENRDAQRKVIMKKSVDEKSSAGVGSVTPFRAASPKPNVSRARSTSPRSGRESIKD